MMANIRDRIASKTSNLPTARDIDVTRIDTPEKRHFPKTAPGIMGALAAAESRIQELESESAQKSLLLVANIKPNPYQPRIDFSEEGMQSLANSIEESGLIQPIVVRKHPQSEGLYQVVAGERRLRAHILLGRTEIEAKVIEVDDHLMATLALTENLGREDLSDYEAYKGIAAVQAWWPSRKSLAESLGISRAQLYRLLSYGGLPECVLSVLDSNPSLLSSATAGELKSYLDSAGSPAITALEKLLPKLVERRIEQFKIVPTLKASVENKPQDSEPSSVIKLFNGSKIAGRIVRNSNGLTIKLRSAALTREQETKLRDFVVKLCEEP